MHTQDTLIDHLTWSLYQIVNTFLGDNAHVYIYIVVLSAVIMTLFTTTSSCMCMHVALLLTL